MKLIELMPVLDELENNGNYRFHMAKTFWDKEGNRHSPLDAIARGDKVWLNWQIWKTYNEKKDSWKNRFPKKYIVSFAHVTGDNFLFGGIFEVKERKQDKYVVKLIENYKSLIGRLVITCEGGTKRNTTFTPRRLKDRLELKEVYPIRYSGEVFRGGDLINHDFSSLEIIFRNQLQDWKNYLTEVKGIYLLTDKKTGKHYVGSASGKDGIWGRWSQYIFGLTGGNKKLIKLVEENGEDYFKNNFKFSILEIVGSNTTENEILKLESLWKDKLLSRKEKFGYNVN